MCPPLHYRQRAEEREQALSEWRRLYRLLRDELSVDVDLLEPRPELPDLVHVASGGFVAGDTFIASRVPDAPRDPRSEPLENFFLVRGYGIEHLQGEVHFQGDRDMAACNGTLFAGCRSGRAKCAYEEIGTILGSAVVGLELADHWQQSLATCLRPMVDNAALFCPAAFTGAAREELEARIPKLVPLDEKDGGAIICDSLMVGKDLIMAAGHPAMRPMLENLGLIVHELPLGEYREAGGPRSLALRIH